MSVFDGVSQEEDPKSFKFLKRINKTSRSFLHKKILLECPIFCLRKDGSIEQFYLKILDHKFVLFQVYFVEVSLFILFLESDRGNTKIFGFQGNVLDFKFP